MLTDLVDGNISLLPKAAGAFSDAAKGKRSKVLEMAQTHGVFDVDYVTKELGDIDPKRNNQLKEGQQLSVRVVRNPKNNHGGVKLTEVF